MRLSENVVLNSVDTGRRLKATKSVAPGGALLGEGADKVLESEVDGVGVMETVYPCDGVSFAADAGCTLDEPLTTEGEVIIDRSGALRLALSWRSLGTTDSFESE